MYVIIYRVLSEFEDNDQKTYDMCLIVSAKVVEMLKFR